MMSFITTCLLLLLGVSSFCEAAVQINEIVSSNGSTFSDEDGDFEDWVELVNTSTEPVQLEGFSLSDNLSNLQKWIFPQYLMNPGEYLVVFASGKDIKSGTYLHTNFNISADGEPIIVTNAAGDTLDLVQEVEIPRDISYGRVADGSGNFTFFQQPTPGAANSSDAYNEELLPPEFSHKSGFYTENFTLTLSSTDPAVQIYYTLDGSVPDPGNCDGSEYTYKTGYQSQNEVLWQRTYLTTLYSAPVPIHEKTVDENPLSDIQTSFDTAQYQPLNPVFRGVTVRAIAIKEGALSSPVQTCTYLVDTTLSRHYPVQVVSITLPETSLFEYDSGIYVPGKIYDDATEGSTRYNEIGMQNPDANYNERGDAWEREANFELLDTQGESLLNQTVGLRIHGGWTRAAENKSLRVYARNRYGDNAFKHQFFKTKDIQEFKTILLRNSGNDYSITRFRDAMIQSLVSSLKIDQQASCPAVLFINGEYWGITNIRDRLDKYYLESHYGFDADNVDMLSVNMMSQEPEVVEGGSTHFVAMLDYIQSNDVSDPAVYEQVGTMMDIENYILYQAIEIFSRNTDWPQNNCDWWRCRTDSYQPDAPYGHDGRWRWMLYDLDFGFGIWDNTADHNTLEHAACITGRGCQSGVTQIFGTLLMNDTFRTSMINQIADLMNTVFHVDTVVAKIDEMKNIYAPLMDEHINRWKKPKTISNWELYIDSMLIFTNERKGYMVEHMMDFFTVDDTVQITLGNSEIAGGAIKINTVKTTGTTWTGMYFKGVPVTIQAVPTSGYLFSHWSGSVSDSSSSLRIIPEENMQLTANFIRNISAITTLRGQLTHPRIQSVMVYNCKGQKVALLSGSFLKAHTINRSLRLQGLPKGVYFVRLLMDKKVVNKIVTLYN